MYFQSGGERAVVMHDDGPGGFESGEIYRKQSS